MSHGDFDGVREVDLGCLLLLETFERLVMMSQFTWCVSEYEKVAYCTSDINRWTMHKKLGFP